MRTALHTGLSFAAGCLSFALALHVCAEPLDASLAPVNAALQAGQADNALSLISALPQHGENNAQALDLACRVKYTLTQWEAAIRDCEQAVHLDPHNARHHLWLGRALGEKASRASVFSAFSIAKRVVAEFQQATQLAPQDAEALSDLGTYYVQAPSVVGGGVEKAEGIAAQLDHVDPARAYELRAQIDLQRKDNTAAEAEFKKAISVSSHPASQWTSLAHFYQDRKRWDDMDAAIHSCVTAAARDPHSSVALYDAAGILISAKHDPALAAKLLQDYLASSSKTEEAPAFVAYTRLAVLQRELGDASNARSSQAAALQLAHEYQPAQDLKR